MIKLHPTILWIGCPPQNFIFTYFWTINKSEHHYRVSSSEEKKQAHRFGDLSIFCHEYKIHWNEDWGKGAPEDLLCTRHCVRRLAWSKLLFAVLLSFFFWNDNWKMSSMSPVIHIPYFFDVQVAQYHVLQRHIKSSILFISKATQPEWPNILTSSHPHVLLISTCHFSSRLWYSPRFSCWQLQLSTICLGRQSSR